MFQHIQVAVEIQAREGQPVSMIVLRHGSPIELALVPQKWSGRGLVGCHLRSL